MKQVVTALDEHLAAVGLEFDGASTAGDGLLVAPVARVGIGEPAVRISQLGVEPWGRFASGAAEMVASMLLVMCHGSHEGAANGGGVAH